MTSPVNTIKTALEMGVEAEKIKENYRGDFKTVFEFEDKSDGNENGNTTFSILGALDNMLFMSEMKNRGYGGKFDFIYLDPPFFSRENYFANASVADRKIKVLAYEDGRGESMEQYLQYIVRVFIKAKELLRENGVLAVHLDWHSCHYAKVLLDEIFGYEAFVNEIIWKYKSGGARKKGFARKHDNILIYAKGKDFTFNEILEKSYNRGKKPYRFKDVEEFQDDEGWYTLVKKRDVWDIDMVGRSSKERTGYATQKPQKLLDILIEAFTCEGDLVGDFFLGSGTTFKSANALNRNFIGCDINGLAMAKALGGDWSGSIKLIREKEMKNFFEADVVKMNRGEISLINYNLREALKDVAKSKEDLDDVSPQDFVEVAVAIDDRNKFICMASSIEKLNKKLSESLYYRRYKVVIFDVFGNINEISGGAI